MTINEIPWEIEKMSHPFNVANALRDHTGLQKSELYDDLAELLIRWGRLNDIADNVKGAHRGTVAALLSKIANSTLLWGKPFEFHSAKTFGMSRVQDGVGTVSVPERTARRVLKILCDEGYILRFTVQLSNRLHYALNLEKIMLVVRDTINAKSAESDNYREVKSLCDAILAHKDFKKLLAYIKTFAGKVYGDIKDFAESLPVMGEKVAAALADAGETVVETLKNVGEKVVANLTANVRAAKEGAREVSTRKEAKRAAQPLVVGANVNAQAGLDLWHKEVRDTENHPGFSPDNTGKTRGQMGHWLKELVAQGMSEDENRFQISQIVRKWKHVDERSKQFTRISQKGLPCKERMDIHMSSRSLSHFSATS